jgi:hypothetical protein
MTSIAGSKAPLHRRFDEKDALRQIRNRYLGMKEDIAEQVKTLQAEPRFLKRCEAFYAKGYKDWHILAAIYNLMIQIHLRALGNRLTTNADIARSKDSAKAICGKTFAPESFLTPELDFMFELHAMTCLKRLGFETRTGVETGPVIKFLRERMRHFDLDVPHLPMFGNPPGNWPEF